MNTADVKHCPICNLDLPVDKFGICRNRRDGRNLYCKPCVRSKNYASRAKANAMKAKRRQLIRQGVFVTLEVPKLTPKDRVLNAIRNGAVTQAEMAFETKLD